MTFSATSAKDYKAGKLRREIIVYVLYIDNDTHYSSNNHLSIVCIDYHKYVMHMSMGRDRFWKTGGI